MPSKRKVRTEKTDLIPGQKFNRLTVIEYSHTNKYREKIYKCLCSCGKETKVRGYCLRKGKIGACGCISRDTKKTNRMSIEDKGFKFVLRNYRSKAKDRGLCFLLSEDELKNLIQQDCYYCGKSPSNAMLTYKDSEKFIYNGVDRRDNKIGYIIENCVTACDKCNTAKSCHTIESFDEWIDKVYSNLPKIIELEKSLSQMV